MAWRHFKPGQAPRNYRFSVTFVGSAPTMSPPIPTAEAKAILVTTMGREFPISGFRVTIENIDNNPEPTDLNIVTLEFPGIGYTPPPVVSSGWLSPKTVRVELDDVVLNESCSPWDFEASELRWYIDDVLQDTVTGGIALAGVGYDHRLNRTKIEFIPGIARYSSPAPRYPDCDGDESETAWVVSGYAEGGWQHFDGVSWVSESTVLETAFTLPPVLPVPDCPPCSCSETLPGITAPNTYTVTASGLAQYNAKLVTVGTFSCKCWDGSGSGILTLKLGEVAYVHKTSYVVPHTSNEGVLFGHDKFSQQCCGCTLGAEVRDCNTKTATSSESIIYCGSHQSVLKWSAIRYCYQGFIICPDPPEQIERFNCAGEHPRRLCIYSARRTIGHTPYPCAACIGNAHLTSFKTGIYYAAIVQVDGSLCIWRFDMHAASRYVENVFSGVDSAQIAVHPKGAVVVVFDSGGSVFWAYSKDLGETWSTPALISTGTNPAISINQRTGGVYVAIQHGATWHLWKRRVPDFLAWKDLGPIATISANYATIEVAASRRPQVLAAFSRSDDAIVTYFTTDNGQSWSGPEFVAAGQNGSLAVDNRTGVMAVAVYDSSEWRLFRKDGIEAAWINAGALSAGDNVRCGCEFGFESPHKIVQVVQSNGNMKRYMSTDLGETAMEA